MDSYTQRQISESDCEIRSNCGKTQLGVKRQVDKLYHQARVMVITKSMRKSISPEKVPPHSIYTRTM